MDPNKLLSEILDLTERLRELSDVDLTDGDNLDRFDPDVIADYCALVEKVDNLNAWLEKGGFLPARWRR